MSKNNRRGTYWRYYVEVEGDHSIVVCTVPQCGLNISRGNKEGPKANLSAWGMKNHLCKCHSSIWTSLEAEAEEEKKKNEARKEELRKRDETVKGSV